MSVSNRKANLRISRLNECLLSFTPYPMENVRRLTALCGELLGAACTFYSWWDGHALYTPGMWHAPSRARKGPRAEKPPRAEVTGYSAIDKPDGRIAYDVIRGKGDALVLIRDLPETPYAAGDPVVAQGGFRTFLGRGVRCEGQTVGS